MWKSWQIKNCNNWIRFKLWNLFSFLQSQFRNPNPDSSWKNGGLALCIFVYSTNAAMLTRVTIEVTGERSLVVDFYSPELAYRVYHHPCDWASVPNHCGFHPIPVCIVCLSRGWGRMWVGWLPPAVVMLRSLWHMLTLFAWITISSSIGVHRSVLVYTFEWQAREMLTSRTQW